jgi:hypothetical protein
MKGVLAVVLGVCLLGFTAAVKADAVQAKPLTNADVIALAKAGMGDDVIIAKINQSATVDFKTDVADLKALKSAGVSDKVISVMLNKSSAPATQPAPSTAKPSGGGAGSAGVYGPSDVGVVSLDASDKKAELRSVAGTMSSTYAYVTMLMHSNFEGLRAEIRTTDKRPSVIVKSPKSPKGRLFYVIAEPDKDDNVRSVKLGNSRFFGSRNVGAPDSDNQIECDIVQIGPDTWKMTPKKDLKPGEYGIWLQTHELFDFGID